MQSEMSPSRRAVLDALMAAGEPQSLDNLHGAEVADLSRSALLRQLQSMVEEGLVERRGERKSARYVPIQRIDVGWTARLGNRWQRIEWSCKQSFDWRYPLVGRIESPVARQVLIRFLEVVEDSGLTRPWNVLRDLFDRGEFDKVMQGWDEQKRKEFRRQNLDRASHGPLTIAVFGSTARGDDREHSDIDVFVDAPPDLWVRPDLFSEDYERGRNHGRVRSVVPLEPDEDCARRVIDYKDQLADLAADVSLGAARPIDIHVGSLGSLPRVPSVPTPIKSTVRSQGVTIYTTGGPEDFVEKWRRSDG